MLCRLNECGRQAFPQKADRLGNGRMGKIYVLVRWDGNKTEDSYHKDFIEFIPDNPVCEIDVSRAPVLSELLGLKQKIE